MPLPLPDIYFLLMDIFHNIIAHNLLVGPLDRPHILVLNDVSDLIPIVIGLSGVGWLFILCNLKHLNN